MLSIVFNNDAVVQYFVCAMQLMTSRGLDL